MRVGLTCTFSGVLFLPHVNLGSVPGEFCSTEREESGFMRLTCDGALAPVLAASDNSPAIINQKFTAQIAQVAPLSIDLIKTPFV